MPVQAAVIAFDDLSFPCGRQTAVEAEDEVASAVLDLERVDFGLSSRSACASTTIIRKYIAMQSSLLTGALLEHPRHIRRRPHR